MSQGGSKDKGHTGRSIHVTVIEDEVYYPFVSLLSTKTPDAVEIAEPVEPAESTAFQAVITNTNESAPKRSGWKKWCSRLATAVVALVAVVAIGLVGMRLAGFRTFTVMSGSMDPEYPVGSMIYVQPVDYHSLKVGDVISYVASDDKAVVTHRIVAIEADENDSSILRFKTQGDANASADAKLVHYKNVLGTPVITVPLIGYFAHNIQQPPGIYITLVVGTLLLAWTFLPGTLEERRKTAKKSVA